MARASNQFTEGEINLLARIAEGLQMGRVDPGWVHDPNFKGIASRVHTMKARIAKLKEEDQAPIV